MFPPNTICFMRAGTWPYGSLGPQCSPHIVGVQRVCVEWMNGWMNESTLKGVLADLMCNGQNPNISEYHFTKKVGHQHHSSILNWPSVWAKRVWVFIQEFLNFIFSLIKSESSYILDHHGNRLRAESCFTNSASVFILVIAGVPSHQGKRTSLGFLTERFSRCGGRHIFSAPKFGKQS